jgi:hypothetical protein
VDVGSIGRTTYKLLSCVCVRVASQDPEEELVASNLLTPTIAANIDIIYRIGQLKAITFQILNQRIHHIHISFPPIMRTHVLITTKFCSRLQLQDYICTLTCLSVHSPTTSIVGQTRLKMKKGFFFFQEKKKKLSSV